MANTVKETVKVSNLSKFGFQIGQEFVNYSKHLPEGDKTKVVPGAEFEAELYVADSGKRYLNKILSSVPSAKAASVPSATTVDTERAKKFVPKFEKKAEGSAASTSMSKADWQAKDRSQLIGGLSHDAATMASSILNVQPAESVSDALKVYKELLEGMLKIREEVR